MRFIDILFSCTKLLSLFERAPQQIDKATPHQFDDGNGERRQHSIANDDIIRQTETDA